MTSVGIRRGDLRAVAPTTPARVRTSPRRVLPWWQWLAAAAVVAPGGAFALRVSAADPERTRPDGPPGNAETP